MSAPPPPSLAVLSPLPPFPPTAGGTAHITQALRQLSRFYRISLYALATDPAAVRWGPLGERCAEARAFGRAAPAGLSLDPPGVRYECSPDMMAYLRRAWAAGPPAIVQLEFTSMAQYAPLARQFGALTICTAHEVAFRSQLRRARQERDPRRWLRRWAGALSLWRYELLALRCCDLVVTLSPVDAAVLARWLPRLPVAHVPSGVDMAEWPVCFDPAAEDEVLFVGNYQHPPNVDGVEWLVREVWPLVRRARPAARLTLAGRAPPPPIERLAGPDIRVPGTLDDLRPCYARASLVIAPIFWGSGVRIKLLEALACGLPVVTTAVAAEGMGLAHGQSALFAERPSDFAAAIIRLLDDRALRARLGAAGRALAVRDYDWARIGERLFALYESARGARSQEPAEVAARR